MLSCAFMHGNAWVFGFTWTVVVTVRTILPWFIFVSIEITKVSRATGIDKLIDTVIIRLFLAWILYLIGNTKRKKLWWLFSTNYNNLSSFDMHVSNWFTSSCKNIHPFFYWLLVGCLHGLCYFKSLTSRHHILSSTP